MSPLEKPLGSEQILPLVATGMVVIFETQVVDLEYAETAQPETPSGMTTLIWSSPG